MPVIQPRPEISGRIAGRWPTWVVPRIRPLKVEPISDTAVSRSPGPISPLACRTAIRADSAVPVGERSTLPGRIATAAPARSSPPSRTTGPANRQNEMWSQSGFSGWRNPSAAFAAAVIRTPSPAMSRASSAVRAKPSDGASTMTKLSPP